MSKKKLFLSGTQHERMLFTIISECARSKEGENVTLNQAVSVTANVHSLKGTTASFGYKFEFFASIAFHVCLHYHYVFSLVKKEPLPLFNKNPGCGKPSLWRRCLQRVKGRHLFCLLPVASTVVEHFVPTPFPSPVTGAHQPFFQPPLHPISIFPCSLKGPTYHTFITHIHIFHINHSQSVNVGYFTSLHHGQSN